MRPYLVLAMLALAPPFAGAVEDCPVQAHPGAIEVVDGFYLLATALPIHGARVQLWTETNGADGLQTDPTPCGYGKPALEADNRVIEVTRAIPL